MEFYLENKKSIAVLGVLFVLLTISGVFLNCGGKENLNTGQNIDTSTIPTCASGEFIIRGKIGEDSVSIQEKMDDYSSLYMNSMFGNPGSIELSINNRIFIKFDHKIPSVNAATIPYGQEGPARGSIDLTDRNLNKIGNCNTGEFLSKVKIEGDKDSGPHYGFQLNSFSFDPYCSGQIVSGTLVGCHRM